MRIKRLDITGFKSFMDRVVFSFDEGITGVVGPNGCGKSNVVDAIRWAMGEQSAKHLRGRGMEDVIFNGSETHPPLSMAEVTLTFAVSAEDQLPAALAGMPEVAVTRRLFRSGESEYQINRTTCRLLDITELFLGTGVGTKAYSIIEQGRVGQIVSSRPEDRRAFIEEAAGVTKYKARRRAAERKLEFTQQNLLRINDIVAELRKRLESLERQAKRAEKYRALRSELKDIELHVAAHRWLELEARHGYAEREVAQITAAEAGATARRAELEQSVAASGLELAGLQARVDELSAAVFGAEAEVQRDAQELAHVAEDAEASTVRLALLSAEGHELDEKAVELERSLAQATEEVASFGVTSKEDEVALAVKVESLRRTAAMTHSVAEALDQERRHLLETTTALTRHQSELGTLTARHAELGTRGARLTEDLAQLRGEEAAIERVRAEVLERLELHREQARDLTEKKSEEEGTLERLREAFAESEVAVMALKEQLSDRRSRLSSLEQIQRDYEGYDRGVRAVMSLLGEDRAASGVFGLVSEVLAVPPELERAIEAALSERLQHVLVESEDRAWALLEQLKDAGLGRSTFVAVPRVPGAPWLPAVEDEAVLAMASAAVKVTVPALEAALAPVLAPVVVVTDAAAARRLSGREPGYTFVTVEGEVVRPDGTVSGGVVEGPAMGALEKRRQVAELTGAVAHVEERYQEVITRHYELQKQMGHSEGVLKGLERHRHQEELSLTGHEKDLHQAGSSLSRLRGRIAELAEELARVDEAIAGVAFEAERTRGELAHAEADQAVRRSRVELLGAELDALKVKGDAEQEALTELKVRVASAAERAESARLKVEVLRAQRSEVSERRERAGQASAELEAHLGALEQRRGRVEAARAEREARLAGLKDELSRVKATLGEAQATARAAEGELRAVRQDCDALAGRRAELSLGLKEVALELDNLVARARDRHGVVLGEVVSDYHARPPVSGEGLARLEELRAAVARLGEVNVSAIEELRAVEQRHGYLCRQRDDLRASMEQLTDAIARIDETSRARFQETFDIVSAKFQQVFPRLFGGGRASLMLVPAGPGEEPGVEILAQPPGKKLQSVNLFSGGEKALTAVALIFAIFLIKPTPFCLLDEVDAPLDEGNVGRYNEMVREMSKQSQFILITHNKRTMEVVDSLYGVTMEEPGVSKLVSVRLKEAVAANSDQQVA